MKRTMPEIVTLGAYDAALVHKNTEVTKNRRVHMYEIEMVLEDGGVSYIGDGTSPARAYPVRAHSVICAKPGQIRHTQLPFKCLYIHLIVEDGELAALLDAMPDVYTPTDPQAIEVSVRSLLSAYTTPEIDGGMRVMSELCAFLSRLIRDARLTAGVTREHRNSARIIERALAFMDEHDDQNVTLEEIADHVHLSRIYFHNLFVAAVGQTPHRYLLERRLARAQQMLMTTDKALSEIALECGFSSQSYLNQVFKKELNCTPRQYKREMSLRY